MIDLVWETRSDVVEEELKTLLGVEELDRRDPQYFQQRNAAAKLAIEKMSVDEKAQLELDLETRRMEGNPEPVQRQYVFHSECRIRARVRLNSTSRAAKHREKVLQTFSKERWLDMGMSTITFTVHIDEQGRFIGDM
jgi:formate dehydrogenase assembly factor FdhD